MHGEKDILKNVLIALLVVATLIVVLSGLRYKPSHGHCRDRGLELNLPCAAGTARWDGEECKCMSTENSGAKLQYELERGGCQYDD